jgi:chemotaxis protein CheX
VQAVAQQKPKVDIRLIAPFMESVKTVFRTMANVETKLLTPHLKTGTREYNVFGIIGFSGELTGSVTLSFTRDSAENIVESFTGGRLDSTTSHFADAIGELANMVAGSAKSAMGFVASITVPSVVIGEHCQIATPSDIPCVVIPCETAMGKFAVEVCIKQKKIV